MEFLQRNDKNYDELLVNWHENVVEWTRNELREVQRAVKQNTSVHSLQVDASSLLPVDDQDDRADMVASIIQNFNHVIKFHIGCADAPDEQILAQAATVVDKLLFGIINSRSAVTDFVTALPGGPRAIVDFAERFPSIDTFQLGYLEFPCSLPRDFAISLAAAFIRWTTLECVQVLCRAPSHIEIARVLTGLHAAPVLNQVTLGLFDGGDTESTVLLLQDAGLLCSANKTITSFLICGAYENDNKASISSFLNFPGTFSPSLKSLCFENCELPGIETWYEAAGKLQAITTLKLKACDFAAADENDSTLMCMLLERMPQLHEFHLKAARDIGGEIVAPPSAMKTDGDLQRLCETVSNHGMLQHVELDLVNDGDNRSFPAIQTLLRNCKGTLALTCARLSWINGDFVCRGLELMSGDLKCLGLRFCGCEVDDDDFARFF